MSRFGLRYLWAHLRTGSDLQRYLMGPSLSAAARLRISRHLQECQACRQRLDRLHENLQAATGLGILRSTSWQREALFERVWSEVAVAGSQASLAADHPVVMRETGAPIPAWRLGLIGAAAMATLAGLYLAWPALITQSTDSSMEAHVRGGVQDLPDVALGFSGVDAAGAEYEVVESDGICPGDALRIYARVRNPDYKYVAVFAVQEDNAEPTWYFPSLEEGSSYEVPQTDEPWPFPDEIPMQDNHHAGALLVVGVFATQPLSAASLTAEWVALAQDHLGESAFSITLSLLDRWSLDSHLVQGTAIRVLNSCSGGRP